MAIPPPVDAARNLAALLVERNQLIPPIDIEELLALRADVECVDWPAAVVDAVMLRRPGERPQVFYRPVPENRGRERFTLAHELGHIVLPWHLGNAACVPGGREVDPETATEEDQADTFASCLLAPDGWLKELADRQRNSMSELLEELQTAELSTTASLLAVRRVLMAGWVFQINNQLSLYSSPGTVCLPSERGPLQLRMALQEMAHDQGDVVLAGNNVRWWRLAAPSPLPEADDDPRTDTELLRAAIAACTPEEDQRHHRLQSANGKVGGGANDAAGRDPASIYEGLWHRFEGDGRFDDLMARPEFAVWLARKSRRRSGLGGR